MKRGFEMQCLRRFKKFSVNAIFLVNNRQLRQDMTQKRCHVTKRCRNLLFWLKLVWLNDPHGTGGFGFLVLLSIHWELRMLCQVTVNLILGLKQCSAALLVMHSWAQWL